MANAANTGNSSTSADSGAASFMADLMEKFGGPEEAMKAFAMFTAMMGQTRTPAATTSVPPPVLLEVSATPGDIIPAITESTTAAVEQDALNDEGARGEADLTAGLEQLTVDDQRLASVFEGETPVISVGVSAGETPAGVEVDEGEASGISDATVGTGETPNLSVTGTKEGATPSVDVEGETPVGELEGATPGILEEFAGEETLESVEGGDALTSTEDVAEGSTPVKTVGREAQEKHGPVGVETHIYIEGTTPNFSGDAETPFTENILEPVEDGANLIVDLTNVPEETVSPVNTREARRQARRSLLDEIDDSVQQTEQGALGPETATAEQDNSPRPSDGESDKEARRQAVERKRKGKQTAPSLTKKLKGKSVEASLPPPAKVPYAAKSDSPTRPSESEEEPEEELNFKPTEIWLTKELLDAMKSGQRK
ncbi:retinitis pigmentosa 1-like 1 protein [Salvia splendens]|uniref:retinitis pigmentosa 1-like 1 protein n=1 Tax=Salvia splendens TaxID=180675 RepID=UPI001C26F717|nr:retinitis pigmentosa 1-like 1 protein [Salvia splendens]